MVTVNYLASEMLQPCHQSNELPNLEYIRYGFDLEQMQRSNERNSFVKRDGVPHGIEFPAGVKFQNPQSVPDWCQ